MRFFAFRSSMLTPDNPAAKAYVDAEIARAIELLEGELVSVDRKIAELTDRVRRLEGGHPEANA
jgi:hypothetical protein